ncbi:MAG: succinylglutamate desuccinylase/aspartoacylase family protein [Patescibacteria group bacterium]
MIKEIHDQIWQIDSGAPGPTVSISGGVHGNERTGIEIVHRLVSQIEQGSLQISAGKLFTYIGNPKAVEMNKRGSSPHADLNRCFNDEFLAQADDSYEVSRAKLITPILHEVNVSLDIHATNKPSEPMLFISNLTQEHKQYYQWLDAEYIITDPAGVFSKVPLATDEYVHSYGGIGIGFETGQAQDTSKVDSVFQNVLNFLRYQNMLDDNTITDKPNPDKKIIELQEKLLLTEDGFEWADGMGERSFQQYKQGDILGFVKGEPIIAKEDGMFIMPKIPEHWQVGKEVTYLAKKIN